MALKFLIMLIRHDYPLPAVGVRLIVDSVVNDALSIRKVKLYVTLCEQNLLRPSMSMISWLLLDSFCCFSSRNESVIKFLLMWKKQVCNNGSIRVMERLSGVFTFRRMKSAKFLICHRTLYWGFCEWLHTSACQPQCMNILCLHYLHLPPCTTLRTHPQDHLERNAFRILKFHLVAVYET